MHFNGLYIIYACWTFYLRSHATTQSQCITSCRYRSQVSVNVHILYQNGKNGIICDFVFGIAAGPRLLVFSHTGYTEW